MSCKCFLCSPFALSQAALVKEESMKRITSDDIVGSIKASNGGDMREPKELGIVKVEDWLEISNCPRTSYGLQAFRCLYCSHSPQGLSPYRSGEAQREIPREGYKALCLHPKLFEGEEGRDEGLTDCSFCHRTPEAKQGPLGDWSVVCGCGARGPSQVSLGFAIETWAMLVSP